MTARLTRGGRLIDRSQPLEFVFDGKRLRGYAGDTLASALLANGEVVTGRSFKYHRPRGTIARGAEEPNSLLGLGRGDRFEPNARATTTPLVNGLEARSQNRWPSLAFDVGVLNASFGRLLPAGFYYKTFMWPRRFWESVYEPLIRQAAGLGRAPDWEARDPDRYEHAHLHVDVLVAGGGVAGLAAALAAGRSGASVLLCEQAAHWGGRAPVDGETIDARPAADWVSGALDALHEMSNVRVRAATTVTGVYDHGYVLASERPASGPRERLWKVRAGRVVMATGAIERPLPFAGNDRPGVMLASAVRDYLADHGVSPGDRTVVVTNNDDAYLTAIALREAGLVVRCIVDARETAEGDLPQRARALGLRIATGRGIAAVHWARRVTGVSLCAQAGEGSVLETVGCDAVAMSGGWSPVVHLWSHCGGRLVWDEAAAIFRPDGSHPPVGSDGASMVIPAGAASGAADLADALGTADAAGRRAAAETGHQGGAGAAPQAERRAAGAILPVWMMPQGASADLRGKAWLDFQNDVKVSDVALAAREGYGSVEHAKRYTTLGMATDQGKLSNINGLAVLSQALDEPIPQVGTTTFRPPYTPLTFGAITGAATGERFQPVRRTPLHDSSRRAWRGVGAGRPLATSLQLSAPRRDPR